MDLLTKTISKYLYAIPFLVFGLMHLMMADQMAGIVPSFIPGGVFWVYLVGIALIAATVSMLTGKKEKLATLLLGIMLIIFVLSIHLPAVIGGNQMSMGMLLKDTSLAGAAFMISGLAKD